MEKSKPDTTKAHIQQSKKCTTTQNQQNRCSAVAEMGDLLATTDMGLKIGGGLLCPFLGW